MHMKAYPTVETPYTVERTQFDTFSKTSGDP